MQVTASLLSPGNKIMIGRTQCELLEVRFEGLLINLVYRTEKKKEVKRKSIAATKTVKVV